MQNNTPKKPDIEVGDDIVSFGFGILFRYIVLALNIVGIIFFVLHYIITTPLFLIGTPIILGATFLIVLIDFIINVASACNSKEYIFILFDVWFLFRYATIPLILFIIYW